MAPSGDRDAAIETLRRQLAERPGDTEAQKQLGLLLLQAGRPASAVAALRAARDRAPKDIELAATLADALIALGQPEAAFEIGRSLVAQSPRAPGPHLVHA